MSKRAPSLSANQEEHHSNAPPLSPYWKREIDRRVKDLRDPRRYIIKSVLIPRSRRPWELFYNISDDVWAMDIEGATLFKRRKAARAVVELLAAGRDRFRIEEVKVGKKNRIIRGRANK